ncbi:uncharacterized protein BXZ73DRAFT_44, partial [Epithele typhae]|uniref:uncharacterized protein n=1 Tax=Epithele typhae TaxID=378194 RepID=UPI002007CCEF
SPDSLAMSTPSIMLTLPTPVLPQSPVFRPRSPITLRKYMQATTSDCGSPTATPASGFLSPVPSVPSCDRCCLGQLDQGFTCRSCERQWMACKMWYQANDGGRRRWLTEPFIRPAESNANARAVMDMLGVPGAVGLGIEQPPTGRKASPLKVLTATAPARDRHHGCPEDDHSRLGAARWRQLR